jgi:2-iminobutanoate/2-iminopropanoate deaminase
VARWNLTSATASAPRYKKRLSTAPERPSHDHPADQFRPRTTGRLPFSLASEHNGVLYISGMPSLDSEGRFAPGTFEQEADRAWANITAIAAASGYTPDEFLYVQVLLADIGNYGDANDWWRRQFPDPAATPSRLTFQAGALPFGAKIELQAVAAHDR